MSATDPQLPSGQGPGQGPGADSFRGSGPASAASATSTASTASAGITAWAGQRLGWLHSLPGQALVGLVLATLLVLVLLFAGSEDRGFIYVDF